MNKINWTAAQSLHDNLREAREKMAQIEAKIAEMELFCEDGRVNWAEVGDAEHINKHLGQLVDGWAS